jgi:hypothetical protein
MDFGASEEDNKGDNTKTLGQVNAKPKGAKKKGGASRPPSLRAAGFDSVLGGRHPIRVTRAPRSVRTRQRNFAPGRKGERKSHSEFWESNSRKNFAESS